MSRVQRSSAHQAAAAVGRFEALSPERRSEISRMGGKARWAKLTPEQRAATSSANLAKARAALATKPRGRPTPSGLPTPALTDAQQLYRTEKARKDKADAKVIAAAKREYDAMLEKQALARKGGRPASKARGYRLDLTRDPADALVDALQRRR